MKVLVINGSPRKNWNTATLLENTLKGAASQGAETELLHLYDLTYKGCTSCFACKIIDGPSQGRCAMRDDLTPVLDRIESEVDALVMGSPIYFGSMTGEMRSFMERLLFAPHSYSDPYRSLFPRRIKTAFIYTMNVPEDKLAEYGYDRLFASTEGTLGRVIGPAETLVSTDTLQFSDHSKVVMEMFDPEKKATRRREVFPEDCRKAFELGRRLGSSGAWI
ncbi:MAG: flavodoxin family protein [Thermovirgaceae bacterium]|nr:flavodoxin family protein [Thermovirgaceae bacterium]